MSEFVSIAQAHWARYPGMEPQDFGKLAYQSEFGPGHMSLGPDRVLAPILAEWEQAAPGPLPPEPIGSGLCRFPITKALSTVMALPLLGRLFSITAARMEAGSMEGLLQKLDSLSVLRIPGMEEWTAEYRRQGCPPVGHSAAFREAYRPHYRLLRQEMAGFFPALLEIEKLSRTREPAIVAIDGRCGSGKSSLAQLAEWSIPCQVVHMDDFYLPKDRRAPDWMEVPAGNMDLERFREEILRPAQAGALEDYRPFVCRTGRLEAPVELGCYPLTLVEGSYSLYPSLRWFYRKTIFLTCDAQTQRKRLQTRDAASLPAFQTTWIPLEEQYFSQCALPDAQDLVLDTSEFF